MMKYFNSIRLNNSKYEASDLVSLVELKITDQNISNWEKEIFLFIQELISDKDFVYAQSSGTTGKAKQIKLKKSDLIESAIRTQNYLNLSASDKALLCLPASYIAGKMMIVRAFVTGFDLKYVEPSSMPLKGLEDPVDFTAFTPHQLSLSIEDKNINNVKNIIVGGAPVSQKLLNEIQQLNCNVFETYGMTETCSHIAIKPLNGIQKSDYFSILPGFNVLIDERECLVIRLKDGTKLVTNDIVLLESKQFKWMGRFDNVINSGGIKLFPEQIEKKIETVLQQEFFIALEKHESLGAQVILILKSNNIESENFNIKKLRNNLDGVLSSYERPKKLYLLPEFIETSNGKIKRKETISLVTDKRGYVL